MNPTIAVAVAASSLAAGGAGFFVARAVTDDATSSGRTVQLYECPEGGDPAPMLPVHGGDVLWVIGRTGDRWAVVRTPTQPTRPAWIPLADIDVNVGGLPEVSCAQADTDATDTDSTDTTDVTEVTGVVTTDSTPATDNTPTSATPTSGGGGGGGGADTTPPTVSVVPNATSFYGVNSDSSCNDLLTVTVNAADNRGAVTIDAVSAEWKGSGGPGSAALTPIGGNRFTLEVFANWPIPSGQVTIVADVRDTAGNDNSGFATVTLLDPSSNGCVTG